MARVQIEVTFDAATKELDIRSNVPPLTTISYLELAKAKTLKGMLDGGAVPESQIGLVRT